MENNSTTDQVLISHIFNAPREAVFKAWTNPEQLPKWFAPHGCTIRFKQLDIRENADSISCISNPDFGDCWCRIHYSKIVFPELVAFSMTNVDENGNTLTAEQAGMDPEWPTHTNVTVTFEDLGGQTKLTLHQTVSRALAQKNGAYPSWLQMIERLENQLA